MASPNIPARSTANTHRLGAVIADYLAKLDFNELDKETVDEMIGMTQNAGHLIRDLGRECKSSSNQKVREIPSHIILFSEDGVDFHRTLQALAGIARTLDLEYYEEVSERVQLLFSSLRIHAETLYGTIGYVPNDLDDKLEQLIEEYYEQRGD